jgi:hypothetical protein
MWGDGVMGSIYDYRKIGIISTVEVLEIRPDIRKDTIGKDAVYNLGQFTNAPRNCTWRSKDLDFVDQLSGEAMDQVKQINSVKLFYEDLYENLVVTLRVSVDGGLTWCEKQATMGNADGTAKIYVFDYSPDDPVTGWFHTFEIMNSQPASDFKWLGLEVDLTLRGTDHTIPTVT